MIFATTLTVTAIKPRLFAEEGANSPFLQKPVKCTNSELENEASKGSPKTFQGQVLAQLVQPPSTPPGAHHSNQLQQPRNIPGVFPTAKPLPCLPARMPAFFFPLLPHSYFKAPLELARCEGSLGRCFHVSHWAVHSVGICSPSSL